NSAGVGIGDPTGDMTITDTVVHNNGDTGIHAWSLDISNSTVAGNGGQGIYIRFAVNAVNTTIANNRDTGLEVDLQFGTGLAVKNVTIAGNGGQGIRAV